MDARQRATVLVVSVDVSSSLASRNPSLIERMLKRFSADKWVVTLEVRPEVGEPYTIERRYTVPRSIMGEPHGSGSWQPEAGQILAATFDPAHPESVIVDGQPID